MDALLHWLSGPPLVEGLAPEVDHDICNGWQCADLTRVWVLSFVGHALGFFAAWLLSHLISANFRALNFELKTYWVSCIISGVHAVITSQGSLRWTLLNDIYKDGNYLRSLPEQDFYSVLSSAYFAYDLVLHIVMSVLGMARFRVPEMFLHHILGLICFSAAPNYPLSWTAGWWLCTELSSPFTNARFVLQQGGFRYSPLYVANGVMMVLSFLVIRLGLPGTYWYIFYHRVHEFTSVIPAWILGLFVFSGLAGSVLNIIWTYLLLKGFIQVVRSGKSKLE